MAKTNINEISKKQHELAKSKGFYDAPIELGTLLMLITSELGEALEADRKGYYAKMEDFEKFFNSDISKQIKIDAFKTYIKDSFEDEIADTFIRLFDICGYMGIDIDKHIQYKMWYNTTRPYKHNKRY